MATERLKTIKSSGGDYTSLSAAEAGEDDTGDLVSRDEWMHFSCYSKEDITSVIITGWTTDATRYILVDTPSSERHVGVWSTSKYRIKATLAVIEIYELFTRIDGLQIMLEGDDNNNFGIIAQQAYGLRISNNIIRLNKDSFETYGSYSSGIDVGTDVGGSSYMWNNIVYDFLLPGRTNLIGITSQNNTAGNVYVYNNTVIRCAVGISDGYSDIIAKNNIVQDCTNGFNGSFNAASDYNISDLASDAPGAHSKNEATVTFVGADDFHLDPDDTAAINAGINLYNDASLAFQTDIDGDDRGGSGASWDIGADEYVAAGGATIPLSNPFSRPFSQSLGRGGF